MSRTKNSLRNIATSLGGQMLNNVLRWICRVVFIHTLGKEFLGISSLYANILTLLSLSELGMGSAITYSLYEPLAKGDKEAVKTQMLFFKKAYQYIGAAILVLGICLTPFLPALMKGTTDAVNIYLYYMLYLLQTVISYLFFAYKQTLLVADQKRYVFDVISYAVQIGMNAIQILILFVFRSFLLYTITAVIAEAVRNILTAVAVDRKYPYLKEPAVPMTKEEKKSIFTRVYAMSLYKFSSVIGTATDNLVISSNISVLAVGLYDNYNLIIVTIQKLFKGVFSSLTSSIGNYYVLESRSQNEKFFKSLYRVNSWLVLFCSVSFLTLLQPFIELCFGKTYCLDYAVVIVIVYNFATNYQQYAVQIYKDATGLFVKGKYRPVVTAVLNLVISIILVRTIGMVGVFWGSIISRLVTTWWFDAWLLYKNAFEKNVLGYYLDCIGTLILIALNGAVIEWMTFMIKEKTLILLAVRMVLCALIPNIVYFLLYGRSEEMSYVKNKVVSLLKR